MQRIRVLLPLATWACIVCGVLYANAWLNAAPSSPILLEASVAPADPVTVTARWGRFVGYSLLSMTVYLFIAAWAGCRIVRCWSLAGHRTWVPVAVIMLTAVLAGVCLLSFISATSHESLLATPQNNSTELFNLRLRPAAFAEFLNRASYEAGASYLPELFSEAIATIGFSVAFLMLAATCSSLAWPISGLDSKQRATLLRAAFDTLQAFPYLAATLLSASVIRTHAMLMYYEAFEGNGGTAFNSLAASVSQYLGITYTLTVAFTFLPAAWLILRIAEYERIHTIGTKIHGKIDFRWYLTAGSILLPAIIGGSDWIRTVIP